MALSLITQTTPSPPATPAPTPSPVPSAPGQEPPHSAAPSVDRFVSGSEVLRLAAQGSPGMSRPSADDLRGVLSPAQLAKLGLRT